MNRRAPGLAALLAVTAFAVAGCGGGSSKSFPDATVPLDGSGARLDGGAGGSGGTGVIDAGPPVPGANSVKVLSGPTFLVGTGSNSCTNQVPATGDRWCAFAKPSTFLGQFDLWVINATKAAAGMAIRCDGSDTTDKCQRLTTDLFIDAASDIRVHGFDGDTLIYSAEVGPGFVPPTATSDGSGFVGVVYAWRPGWEGGRALTGNSGVICTGHPKVASAICFDNRDTTTVAGQASYDLHAGALPAAMSSPPIGKVDTVLVAASTDAAGVLKFEFDFSPDGAYAAWSARPTANGVETLKVQRIGDATATMVAADVTQWRISPDGTRWYWLKSFNYDVNGAASGTLETATFPAGASPTTVATNVGDYDLSGATGVIFRDGLASGKGPLKVIANVASPTAVTLDTGVLGVVDVSKDGTRAAYAKNYDALNDVSDLFVATAGSPNRCTLSSAVNAAPLGSFLDNGAGVVWADYDPNTFATRGWYTDVATCGPTRFATDILRWLPVGNQGYLYGDDTLTGFEVTLRHATVTGATLPMGTSVQTRADVIFAPLVTATPSSVLYTVNVNDTAQDGLYVNAMLPFTPTGN